MKKTIIILLVAFAALIALQDFFNMRKKHQPIKPRNYTVILSIDGFRWDYDTKVNTPFLDSISKYGVKAEGLQPAFPTKTFPNLYTIATGLYPGNHGLISNDFFASDLNEYYSISNRKAVENGQFYLGEPIWVTAEAQMVKTGSYFWVGSEAKIKGYQPTFWKKYEHNFPYNQRVDSVMAWLNKPYNQRPHLIMWYLDKTDEIGHNFGPDSPQIEGAISLVDSTVGYFIQQMNQLSIKDSINFIIVSDHGMGAMDTLKVVTLRDYLNPNWIDTAIGSNPVILIHPTKGCKDSIIRALSTVHGIKVMGKEEIPERFHYKQSNRVSEIVVLADSAWSINYAHNAKESYIGGTHGYDNLNKDMYGIFYAMGPDFKRNYHAGILYNVDIYNLLATLLEIKPAPNDGQFERIKQLLKEEK